MSSENSESTKRKGSCGQSNLGNQPQDTRDEEDTDAKCDSNKSKPSIFVKDFDQSKEKILIG